jgi:hypothetical protein
VLKWNGKFLTEQVILFFIYLLYIICKMCNKYMFSKFWLVNELCPVAYLIYFFVHLDIISILVLGFYSGLSGRVMMVYVSSLCVVALLSTRFPSSALVWFSNFFKYLVFHWTLCLFVDLHVYVPRRIRNGSESLQLKPLRDFDVGIGGCPP